MALSPTESGRNSTTTTLGRGGLSASGVANRKGYAGYELDAAIGSKYVVRNRLFSAELGRWNQRDSLEYIDDNNLLAYSIGNPIEYVDPNGSSVVADGYCRCLFDCLCALSWEFRGMYNRLFRGRGVHRFVSTGTPSPNKQRKASTDCQNTARQHNSTGPGSSTTLHRGGGNDALALIHETYHAAQCENGCPEQPKDATGADSTRHADIWARATLAIICLELGEGEDCDPCPDCH
jgi:RHS repeat-associated protein